MSGEGLLSKPVFVFIADHHFRKLEWKNWEATLVKPTSIRVYDVLSSATESLGSLLASFFILQFHSRN